MKTIVSVVGGLGNQMFQYAASIAMRQQGKVDLNDSLAKNGQSNYGAELERVFKAEIKNRFLDSALIWLIRKAIVFYTHPQYKHPAHFVLFFINKLGISIRTDYIDLNLKRQKHSFRIICYSRFQSETCFKDHEGPVRETLAFHRERLSLKSSETFELIRQVNSISLHVRRGDYLHPKYRDIFGQICTIEYYRKAIRYILEKVEHPVFFIFSDDINWVMENLPIPVKHHFIDWNAGVKSWEDMCLMSNCKHHIIANSTFSWWGAWLNDRTDKIVICPSKYTNSSDSPDFYPESWLKMDES